jgi:NADH:ubiquinone oxidoreductase subunit
MAVQAVISAANPEHALATMEANIPAWWRAMREGRVRLKPLRYVIMDRDWIREAPAALNGRPMASKFELAMQTVAAEEAS